MKRIHKMKRKQKFCFELKFCREKFVACSNLIVRRKFCQIIYLKFFKNKFAIVNSHEELIEGRSVPNGIRTNKGQITLGAKA